MKRLLLLISFLYLFTGVGSSYLKAQLKDSDWFVVVYDTTIDHPYTNKYSITFKMGFHSGSLSGAPIKLQYQPEDIPDKSVWEFLHPVPNAGHLTCSFTKPGKYRVRFPPNIKYYLSMLVGGENYYSKAIRIEQWGTAKWERFNISGAEKLEVTATDMPQFAKDADLANMFENCKSLVGNSTFPLWDTSNVRVMFKMFAGANSFNLPIGNWNTSNVNVMHYMFENATSFNQPIGNWDTSNVTDMRDMFRGATSFNQPIGNWNTSNVMDMRSMFREATSFNQPIGNWDTSKVKDIRNIFFGASSFNQNIGNWNIRSVTNYDPHIPSYDTKGMFEGSYLSAYNVDKILEGWSRYANVRDWPSNSRDLGLSNKHYCNDIAKSRMQSMGIIIAATKKCGLPGEMYLQEREGRNIFSGVKENGAYEWLEEYQDYSSVSGAPTILGEMQYASAKGVLVASKDRRGSGNTKVYSLVNEPYGSANIETLPKSKVINGTPHEIGTLVYNPDTGNFYEGTDKGWERIDN